jgi:hypothetical protein
VRLNRKSVAIISLVTLVVLALVWFVRRDTGSEPYTVQTAMLSGWKVVFGAPEDPWVVALEPPAAFTTNLLQQVSQKAGQPVMAPPHSALPLVMRQEHADALQGVYGAVDIRRMATEEILETTRFEPVCIGHRIDSRSAPSREIFFLAFNSSEFNQLRIELTPDFPEHAGTGVYDPGALTPVLPIATTGQNFEQWWPIRVDRATDCQAQVVVK